MKATAKKPVYMIAAIKSRMSEEFTRDTDWDWWSARTKKGKHRVNIRSLGNGYWEVTIAEHGPFGGPVFLFLMNRVKDSEKNGIKLRTRLGLFLDATPKR